MPTIFDYLPLIRAQLFCKNILFCNFVTWSSKLQKFVPTPWKNLKYKVPLVLVVVQYVVALVRMRYLVSNGPPNIFLIHIISCCLSITNISHWAMGVACKRKTNEIAAYFNCILVMSPQPLTSSRQNKLCFKDIISTAKFAFSDLARGETVRFTLCLAIYSQTELGLSQLCSQIMPTLMLCLLAAMAPCAMPHFLRSTFPDCAASGDEFVWDLGVPFKFKWVVSVLDMWGAGYGINLAFVAACLAFYLGIICVTEHLKRTRYSLNFKAIMAYKQAQILTTAVNNINQGENIPLFLTDFTFVGITCVYAVIAQNGKLSWPALVIAVVFGFDCTVMNSFITYKVGSNLYELSQDILDGWRRRPSMVRNRTLRRMKASCNVLEVRLGTSGNFLDQMTDKGLKGSFCFYASLEGTLRLSITLDTKMPTIYDYLPLIRVHLFCKSILFCNFVTWSSKLQKFVPTPWKNLKYTVPIVMVVIQYVIVLARMRSLLANGKLDTFLIHIISCCFSITNISHWAMGVACKRKTNEIAAYFNCILVMSPQPLKSSRQAKLCFEDIISTAKYAISDLARGETVRFTLCLGIFSQIMPTLMLCLLVAMAPCAMPHFLRSTFPDCAADGNEFLWDLGVPFKLKSVVSLLDMWGAGYGLNLSLVAACLVFYLGILCVADHLKRTRHSLNLKSIMAFKQAQILTIAVNNINLESTPLFVTDFTFCGITCVYAVIAQYAKLSLPALSIAVLFGWNCTVMTSFIIYKAGSNLYELSQDILDGWRNRSSMLRNRTLRRMKASCNVLKVRLGNSGNFLDKMTPLVIFQFVMDHVASLLLMSA
ncbi:hypothetical protein Fcan01_18042 [Folsomia candida]|uniref:Uncharacterized protein n=1 Tax=Folsomia candida TaxID=158441 RepID=A0A226DPR7_FOLCA|nr:hypothetical protein Fcan01_18042 [Folsomia candida]